MTRVKTRIRIAPDGTLTGRANGLPAGEHAAEIMLLETEAQPQSLDAEALLARVRILQAEIAQLPVFDVRSPDEIIGYNEQGHFR